MSFSAEVIKFREWAAERRSPAHDSSADWHGAEWECDYPDWAALYGAVEELLRQPEKLSQEELNDLLYVLARDNEDERVLEMIAERPELTFTLCDVPTEDWQARWQLAVALGEIGSPAAKKRLHALTLDHDEYVRRRARQALKRFER